MTTNVKCFNAAKQNEHQSTSFTTGFRQNVPGFEPQVPVNPELKSNQAALIFEPMRAAPKFCLQPRVGKKDSLLQAFVEKEIVGMLGNGKEKEFEAKN